MHQYSQAWFDFRGKRDRYADYFKNSAVATEAHRRFCLELANSFPITATICGASRHPTRSTAMWCGAGRRRSGRLTERWCPSAAGGSLPFLPEATLRVLKNIKVALRRARLEPLWIRQCVQSAEELVRHRRDRHRHRDHDADGRKSANRFRLGDVHEESRGAARHAARGFYEIRRRRRGQASTATNHRPVCSDPAARRLPYQKLVRREIALVNHVLRAVLQHPMLMLFRREPPRAWPHPQSTAISPRGAPPRENGRGRPHPSARRSAPHRGNRTAWSGTAAPARRREQRMHCGNRARATASIGAL